LSTTVSDQIEARWRPEIARLRIPSLGRIEAELLAGMAAANNAQRILELGTAIGYSAAYLASGAGPEGRVTAVELNPERAAVARRLWSEAGLAERIELHATNALELVPTLRPGYDLIFVDLFWEIGQLELGRQLARDVSALLRPGGVVIADNSAQQIPAAEGFIGEIRSGPYRTHTVLPLGDGMLFAVKQ